MGTATLVAGFAPRYDPWRLRPNTGGIGALTYPVSADLKIKVELFLNNVWVDISSYVYFDDKIRINRGRSSETSTAAPSSCTFKLKNSDKRFSPRNISGPYYGLLTRNTRVRISVNPGYQEFVRFTGYISEWPPGWTMGDNRWVAIRADGILRRLGQGNKPLKGALQRSILSKNPVAYWPMTDGSSATSLANAVTGENPLLIQNTSIVHLASITGPGGSPDSLPNLIDTSASAFLFTPALRASIIGDTGTGYTVEFIVKGDTTSANAEISPIAWIDDAGYQFDVTISNITAAVNFNISQITDASGTVLIGTAQVDFPIASATLPLDGEWHHVWASVQHDTIAVAYDGTVDTGPGASDSGNARTLEIDATADFVIDAFDTSIGQFAFYPGYFLEDSFEATDGYAGELATTRFVRLCDEEQVFPSNVAFTETFESSTPVFNQSGTWARSQTAAHGGSWSLRSAAIGDGTSTDAVFAVPDGATTMTVWYKVSTEEGFDKLTILRDSVTYQVDQNGLTNFVVSGEVDWTFITVDVSGVRNVTFRYTKDGSASDGSDACWIDDLMFFDINHALVSEVTVDSETMGPQTSATLVNLLRECEAVNEGVIDEDLYGKLRLRSRTSLYNQPPALVLDYNVAVLETVNPTDDDLALRNDWTISRSGGSSANYVKETGALSVADPPAGVGRYDDSATLNVETDAQNIQHASYRVGRGTIDELRYPKITVNLAANPDLIQQCGQDLLGQRLIITNVPTDIGFRAVDQIVQQTVETIDQKIWTIDYNTSPNKVNNVNILESYGFLDCGACTLAEDLDTTETGVDVQILDVCTWVHSDGDYLVTIGDEEMLVTAVSVAAGSGSSWTQTLTVTRSSNGVVQTHLTGAEVHVTEAFLLAL